MNLNELSQKAHDAAVKKGFWNDPLSKEHSLCLVISEIGEAVEADRLNRHQDIDKYKAAMEPNMKRNFFGVNKNEAMSMEDAFKKYMKDTVEDELADVVVRLLDLAGDLQIDFDKMTESNYFRAFGRWKFTENAYSLIRSLTRDQVSVNRRILSGIRFVQAWAEHIGFDLDYAVHEKMRYNATRAIRNGKRY